MAFVPPVDVMVKFAPAQAVVAPPMVGVFGVPAQPTAAVQMN